MRDKKAEKIALSPSFVPPKLGTTSLACIRNRRIFVYTFCLINICLSLSDDANKVKTLNIERA